jgi:hypothetical protein
MQLNTKQQAIEAYLIEQLETGGPYFKSKSIGEDIGLSSREVGTNIEKLQQKTEKLNITNWSRGSRSVTWHVELATNGDAEALTAD